VEICEVQPTRLPRAGQLVDHGDLLMSHKITVEHSFEAGHRLPQLDGKCVSLHGHSWSVAVTVSAMELSPEVTVVEFGALKVGLRRWIDEYLDHATMLGAHDRLITPLVDEGNRVFRFGVERPTDEAERFGYGLPWPTVEAVAVLLCRVAENALAGLAHADGARVERVLVRETRWNTAVYEPPESP
jgi:6-pyruvoyltetrahydropterin/6-carboxytetrahydropterin synthase